MATAAFDDRIDLEALRQRTSEKWRRYSADVLPLFVAESDFPLASCVEETLHAAIARGDTGYAHPKDLAAAYAAFARLRWGYDPGTTSVRAIPEVMIGVAESVRALGGRDAGVIVNSPVYPPFFSTIAEVRARVCDAPLQRDDRSGYSLDFDAIEREMAAGARAYLLCNPHNPVGRVYDAQDLRQIARLAQRYNVVVLADEIHAPLTLPGIAFTPFGQIARETGAAAITFASASKAWNIAGLKCALAIAHSEQAERVLAQFPGVIEERAGHLGVLATIAAFRQGSEYLDEVLAHLDTMRANLRAYLDEAGLEQITFTPPQAGYLAWLDCRALALDAPAKQFLRRGDVALYPGTAFGSAYAQWVRLNFATSTAILKDGLARMRAALA